MNKNRHIEQAAELLAASGHGELADKIRQRDNMLQRELDRRATKEAKHKARIAELEARINILLEHRNRLGQDVQNAAITGVVPEDHAIGAQLGLVANMRARVAGLERQAAIGRRAVVPSEWRQIAHPSMPYLADEERKNLMSGIKSTGPVCLVAAARGIALGLDRRGSAAGMAWAVYECLTAILREAEQVNSRVILDSSAPEPATVAGDNGPAIDVIISPKGGVRADFSSDKTRRAFAGQISKFKDFGSKPATVAVDAGALGQLRVTVEDYDKAWTDDMPQRQKIAALHMARAARLLLAGGE